MLDDVIGGIVRFGIGYFGKCTSGVCPMTSNSVVNTILDVLIRAMVTAR
ncbi:MAG: DUF6132 family protein [Candidatus Omnitrophica bacterium]|nr:DUF6132 family protein [Candidatus Omnitrophota bacterium]